MNTYTGSCHCGAVQFEVETDLQKTLECNCSHCAQKGFILTFVDNDKFKLLSGEDALTSYLFNKKHIDHRFCSICGVQSFAYGIGFPQTAINVRCLNDVDLSTLSPEQHNGKDM